MVTSNLSANTTESTATVQKCEPSNSWLDCLQPFTLGHASRKIGASVLLHVGLAFVRVTFGHCLDRGQRRPDSAMKIRYPLRWQSIDIIRPLDGHQSNSN